MGERIRGRAGVEQRKRRMTLHPQCAECARRGLAVPTDEIDHILALALGGTDEDDNVQGLCSACHRVKTARESAASEGAATHPDWLAPSAIPLTIVCGPPCSGKTTYVQSHAGDADTIIDLDLIRAEIDPSFRHWTITTDDEVFRRGIRVRNAMLGTLSRAQGGRAWFIVSAPSEAERTWWQDKLGGTIVLLDPGDEECRRRAMARGTPLAIPGIVQWRKSARRPWSARTPKKVVTIGFDGWPV